MKPYSLEAYVQYKDEELNVDGCVTSMDNELAYYKKKGMLKYIGNKNGKFYLNVSAAKKANDIKALAELIKTPDMNPLIKLPKDLSEEIDKRCENRKASKARKGAAIATMAMSLALIPYIAPISIIYSILAIIYVKAESKKFPQENFYKYNMYEDPQHNLYMISKDLHWFFTDVLPEYEKKNKNKKN